METYLNYGLAAKIITPYEKIQTPSHQDIECSFIDRGKITYLMGTDPITISAGCWTMFWAALPHHVVHADPNAKLYWLTIPLSRFLKWGLSEDIVEPLMNGKMMNDVRGDLKLDKAIFKRWTHDLDLNCDERQEVVFLELEARIRRMAFYAKIAEKTTLKNLSTDELSPFQIARHMANYVSQYYMRSITIQQVAETAGLDTNEADAMFLKFFNSSIENYIMRYRVAHAQQLLVATDLSLKSIASRSGFESFSIFFDVFKSACHHTPKAYRAEFSIVN